MVIDDYRIDIAVVRQLIQQHREFGIDTLNSRLTDCGCQSWDQRVRSCLHKAVSAADRNSVCAC